ncbi:alpha/beta hydrolase [Mucilaginibacter sp. BJC16-A38]|uniref:alpha/beta fold hydrolase n=1 Tax=Mucilaginibacter phenanthrenivorans TaxID=1234842 RepID=UPI002157465D|nr:alpha/beta hydrolase [Mucilaginibacter phenanthrenivorans]MCR8556154.1 alpha/beta hydrolase [Mucilaginibacter phenanthrenivorans]
MTDHYFENNLVKLHYYKFGSGPQIMLSFHGYGMHGKQFKILETNLGEKYTFIGFDLFFHKETKLKDQTLTTVKKGITKKQLADLILGFCEDQGIKRFSVIGYSMGTHYATVVAEELPTMIDELIIAAPSSLNPGRLITFFSKSKTGNKIMEKMVLSETTLIRMLKLFKRLRVIDNEAYKILYGEIGTADLRFNFYACFTYLRAFETDERRLTQALNEQNIKSIFIFGKRDRAFPPGIGKDFIAKLNNATVVVLDEGHEMIKKSFVNTLTDLLL